MLSGNLALASGFDLEAKSTVDAGAMRGVLVVDVTDVRRVRSGRYPALGMESLRSASAMSQAVYCFRVDIWVVIEVAMVEK